MAAGTTTAAALARLYLERIKALDSAGPRLCSVIEINPEALVIAAELDAERDATGPRGPLHGVCVLLKVPFRTSRHCRSAALPSCFAGLSIGMERGCQQINSVGNGYLKDNVETADLMHTTAGSLARAASSALLLRYCSTCIPSSSQHSCGTACFLPRRLGHIQLAATRPCWTQSRPPTPRSWPSSGRPGRWSSARPTSLSGPTFAGTARPAGPRAAGSARTRTCYPPPRPARRPGAFRDYLD